jgi:hypothetical protein
VGLEIVQRQLRAVFANSRRITAANHYYELIQLVSTLPVDWPLATKVSGLAVGNGVGGD